jgi:hypothetical protein
MADQSRKKTEERQRQLTGDDIISEVLRNCEQGMFRIRHITVLPSVYHVYLHPSDYETIRPLVGALTAETRTALIEKLDALNEEARPSRIARHLGFDSGKQMDYKILDPDWTVEFHPDVEGRLAPGDVEVYSDLASAARPDFGEGAVTRHVTRRQSGASLTETRPVRQETSPDEAVYARINYKDASGPRSFSVSKNQIVIGRGGKSFWVDLKLDAPPDVSREHCRVRRDPATGKFYLKDVSQFGTSVDGSPVPSSLDRNDGDPKDKNLEVPLPPRCTIGLAEVFFLQFESAGVE